MKEYYLIIGLETHLELNTNTKMFCSCSAEHFNIPPNTHTCPTCLGLPGSLPVANQLACEYCLKLGLALNCKINHNAVFARKHYSYPDLAKGYQISQYELPFCEDGEIEIQGRIIKIKRVHMEEDTGKLDHSSLNGKDVSLVNFNRAGVPLVEIVTEADFRTVSEVEEYSKRIQQLARYLNISSGDMEKGAMRFEANLSLQEVGNNELPNYKIELKNIASFKAMISAINYEITRQTEILNSGQIPSQETRGWDDSKNKTYSQRTKEDAQDYRYFPDPDIPPMNWMLDLENNLKNSIPELPWTKKARFIADFALSEYDARLITDEPIICDIFENAVILIQKNNLAKDLEVKKIKKLANWLLGELMRLINLKNSDLKKINLDPEHLVELINLIDTGKLSQSNAKVIFEKMLDSRQNPNTIMLDLNLEQTNNLDIMKIAVKKVINDFNKAVLDYKSGKQTVIQFLIGMVMKELKGRGDVEEIKAELLRQLQEV